MAMVTATLTLKYTVNLYGLITDDQGTKGTTPLQSMYAYLGMFCYFD